MIITVRIVIFTLSSISLSASYRALKRNDKKVYRLFLFVSYFLVMKSGFIPLNIPKDYSSSHSPSAIVRELRAGSQSSKETALVVSLLRIFSIIFQNNVGSKALVPYCPQTPGQRSNPLTPGHLFGQPNPSRNVEGQSSMHHQKRTDLTPSQKRNLLDKRNEVINIKGRPPLILSYKQLQFKIAKHGKIHGLPTENGKTLKTEENISQFKKSLIAMAKNDDAVWFENGGYQKGTERGFEALNIFNKKSNVITVYKPNSEGQYYFVTTCKLDNEETANLFKTNGNFLTSAVLNANKDQTNTKNNDL